MFRPLKDLGAGALTGSPSNSTLPYGGSGSAVLPEPLGAD
jgi:hypothetical protein